jgi:hypothetical protein
LVEVWVVGLVEAFVLEAAVRLLVQVLEAVEAV